MSKVTSNFYLDFFREEFIKKKIQSGLIPKESEIRKELESQVLRTENFTIPLVAELDYRIEEFEESSASDYNTFRKVLLDDLKVLNKALLFQEQSSVKAYDSSFFRLKGLKTKAEELKIEMDKLLFSSKNSEKYESLFYERFFSSDMIDKENTTSELDLETSVIMNPVRSTSVVDFSKLSSLDVLTQNDSSISSSQDSRGLSAQNLLDQSTNLWHREVYTDTPLDSLYVDIIFSFNSNVGINNLLLDPSGLESKTQTVAEIFFSLDNLNWRKPKGGERKRLFNKTSFNFSLEEAPFWKIRLTKIGNDGFLGGRYLHAFGLRSVIFYGNSYEKQGRESSSLFYSKIITPENLESISSVNFRVCEEKPLETSINYQASFLTDSVIQELENHNLLISDLKFYDIPLEDSDSYTFDILKLQEEPIIDSLILSTSNYSDQKEGDFTLSPYDVPSELSKLDTILLREKGDNALFSQLGKYKRFDNRVMGWIVDEKYYHTYVLIEKEKEDIDFGPTNIFINGKKESGLVTLFKGINYIISPKEHWHSIDLSSVSSAILSDIDPYYPYNHKYLIEGIGETLYGVDLTQTISGDRLIDLLDPSLIYRKEERKNWARYLSEVDFKVFENLPNSSLDVFSYKVDNNNIEKIVLKSTTEKVLQQDETFSIITKLHDSDKIRSIIFKAILRSSLENASPILTEYLIKFR